MRVKVIVRLEDRFEKKTVKLNINRTMIMYVNEKRARVMRFRVSQTTISLIVLKLGM